MTDAYPLAWPDGWPRTRLRKGGSFGVVKTKHRDGISWKQKKSINVEEATKRVFEELEKLGVKNPRDDAVISTNLKLNLRGFPHGDATTSDPGVAVYWQIKDKPMRVMAIDAYYTVADKAAIYKGKRIRGEVGNGPKRKIVSRNSFQPRLLAPADDRETRAPGSWSNKPDNYVSPLSKKHRGYQKGRWSTRSKATQS